MYQSKNINYDLPNMAVLLATLTPNAFIVGGSYGTACIRDQPNPEIQHLKQVLILTLYWKTCL